MADALGVLPKKIQRTRFVPSGIHLNTSHSFQPIWALCPGWNPVVEAGNNAASGSVQSVGQIQIFSALEVGDTGSDVMSVVPKPYGHGIGSVRALKLAPTGTGIYGLLGRGDDDLGIIFPNLNDLCIVTIAHWNGDGRPGGGDPRIYSKDLSSAADGHDLMIGTAASGLRSRTRIRMNGSTVTVVHGQNTIQTDSLNLISGGITGTTVTVRHIRENGGEDETTGSGSGSYDPRTTTDIGIGGNSALTGDNAFNGEVIIIGAFAHNLSLNELRSWFYNPWQIFQLETQIISTGIPTAQVHGVVPRWVPW